jgi:AcrR family transcriptional regulator
MVTAKKRSARTEDVSGGVPTEILNAAESLFAEHGYDGVSVRNIADRAEVRLGLVSYYFPAKQQIFESVVQRRAAVLHERKMQALAAATAAGRTATPGEILTAFLEPSVSLALEGGQEWRDYSKVSGQLAQSEAWNPLRKKYFDPTIKEFVAALKGVLPHATEESLHYGLWFSAMLVIAVLNSSRRLDELTNGRVRTSDLEATKAWLLPFVTAGFAAIQLPSNHPSPRLTERQTVARRPQQKRPARSFPSRPANRL